MWIKPLCSQWIIDHTDQTLPSSSVLRSSFHLSPVHPVVLYFIIQVSSPCVLVSFSLPVSIWLPVLRLFSIPTIPCLKTDHFLTFYNSNKPELIFTISGTQYLRPPAISVSTCSFFLVSDCAVPLHCLWHESVTLINTCLIIIIIIILASNCTYNFASNPLAYLLQFAVFMAVEMMYIHTSLLHL